ncbi:MAG: CapA family protein [Oscillospiraceae bacterium]|nr:CapA family protein [Oscillospiraceae bacterium]
MKFRYFVFLSFAILTMTGCNRQEKIDSEHVIDISSVGLPEQTEPTTEPPFKPAKVNFVAVGDDLVHSYVYSTAKEQASDDTKKDYDFHYCYENIADRIANADLAFVNQETLICNGKYDISGTNLNFNSPVELGDDLIDIGFDIINIANNHMLDKTADGLEACLDYWSDQQFEHDNLVVMGAYYNEEDMQDYRIIKVKGLKFGFLGYTEHTNGYSLPESSDLQIVYTDNEELIKQQIQELSEQVDCVIVSAHWGIEDSHEVTDEVKALAQNMINWGADVIIGTGSHTLETMEYLTREDGSKGFVFYSLGNFISAQTDNFNMVGGMGMFDICRDTEGVITIENIKLTPLITHYDSGLTNVRVYPYDLYTDELIEKHYVPYSSGGSYKSWNREVIDTIIQENVPKQYQFLTAPEQEESEQETESDSSNNA